MTTQTYIIAESPDGIWHGTLSEFLIINGIGPEDAGQIISDLSAGKVYHGGGGAAGEYTVSIPR